MTARGESNAQPPQTRQSAVHDFGSLAKEEQGRFSKIAKRGWSLQRGGRIQLVHNQKASGNLSLGSLRLPALFAVCVRRVAHAFVKETAERSQALKADFEANIRNPQVGGTQKLFGFFNASFDQVLVRSLVKSLAEQAQKMVAGETCLTRNLIQIQRVIVTVIDEITRPA